MTYAAPLQDMRFVINQVVGLDRVSSLPGCEDLTPELVDAILEEAGKFAAGVLAPTNRAGDVEGSKLENGAVRTPAGFKSAYDQFVAGGWNSVPFDPEHGGQGLPWLVSIPLAEMWTSANMAFSLCPLLNQGATELLATHGSTAQKDLYLGKMIEGTWTGTMNLTEPQAGSDLGLVKTRAVPDGDHYLVSGQKIFITYGEHDLAENIIHMVLARTPDAPEGTRGISLFIVPKYVPGTDGAPGERNDLSCVSIEHKLGIMASPTCVMSYGDEGGAVGYLVGEEGRGLEYMFTMMNTERLGVGLQGLAVAETAYQQALAYARERVQSKPLDGSAKAAVPIIRHPDVRRMLITMKAHVEAMRALAYESAAAIDVARRHPEEVARARSQRFVDLMIPVVKAWFTDLGVELTSTNIQVHGGMGFIEETGAAQLYRDARIAPIYEGTNAIQANDLMGRKVARDGGAAAREFLDRVEETGLQLARRNVPALVDLARPLDEAAADLRETVDWVVATYADDPNRAAAVAVPFLRLFATVAGGWMMAREALAAETAMAEDNGDAGFLDAKLATARFFADHVLSQSGALRRIVVGGGPSIMALPEDEF